jgi:hypothetical protein
METAVTKQELVAQRWVAKSGDSRPAYVLSVIVAMLTAVVSVIGLRFPSVYRSNRGNGTSLGNDLV